MSAVPAMPEDPRRGLWATGAGLLAMAALYLNSPSLLLPALGLAMALRHLTPSRVPDTSRLMTVVRFSLYAAAFITSMNGVDPLVSGMVDPRWIHFVGQACAAEGVLQAWRVESARTSRGLAALFLGAIAMDAATITFDGPHVRYVAPPYVFCVLLALREYLPRIEGTASAAVAWAARARRLVPVALAVLLGGAMHLTLAQFHTEITNWSNDLLLPKNLPPLGRISGSPRLGGSMDVELSPARVLRIEGDAGSDHLRGFTFSMYSRGTWGPEVEQQRFVAAPAAELRPAAGSRPARLTRYQEDYGVVLAPLNAAGVAVPDGVRLEWAPTAGQALRAHPRGFLPLQYEVAAGPGETAQGPLAGRLEPWERARYLQVPAEVDPGVARLARRIGGSLRTPAEKIEAVVRYLVGHHHYSLNIEPMPGDPVSTFLLERRSAHCQYFGSAATILLRLLGVPTRYVNGYMAHESAGPGVVVVRQRDAHAWAESWIDGLGWVTVEATPGDGQPRSTARGLPFWVGALERLQDGWFAVAGTFRRMGPLAAGALLGLTGTAGLGLLLVRRRRRTRPAVAGPLYPVADPRVAALAARFEALLRRHGIACPPHRPWEEHLAQLLAETGSGFRAATAGALWAERGLGIGADAHSGSEARASGSSGTTTSLALANARGSDQAPRIAWLQSAKSAKSADSSPSASLPRVPRADPQSAILDFALAYRDLRFAGPVTDAAVADLESRLQALEREPAGPALRR